MPFQCDFNATTPLDSEVVALMHALMVQGVANPSSPHRAGQQAKQLLEEARQDLASALGASPSGVIFTSGATEAAFIAVMGFALAAPASRDRMVISAVEHKAVFAAAETAAKLTGKQLVVAPVNSDGVIDVPVLESLLDGNVALLAVMTANNETGALQPLDDIVDLASQHAIDVFADASQSIGKEPFDFRRLGVSAAAISAHKFNGPRGIGALLLSPDAKKRVTSVMPGGGQESALRGGTENVIAAIGMATAAQNAMRNLGPRRSNMVLARDAFEGKLREVLPNRIVNSQSVTRLDNTSNFRIPSYAAEELLLLCPDLEASPGSACQSASPMPSHVLTAMGLTPLEAEESLRISFGHNSGADEAESIAELIGSAAQQIDVIREGERG